MNLNSVAAHKGATQSGKPQPRCPLRHIPLLAGLPDEFVDYVSGNGQIWQGQTGRVLYQQGEPEQFIALVLSGCVHHVLQGPDGREVIHRCSGYGDLLGETALFDPQAHSSSAFAAEPSQLLLLHARHFDRLNGEAHFRLRVQQLLCNRLRHAHEFIESISLHRLEARLARHFLLEIDCKGCLQDNGVAIPLPTSQSILAARINVSRPKLNAQLQLWQRQGLMLRRPPLLIFHDLAQLQQIAQRG
ncbi:Crp/Fnr family transcriptional regulator [Chitinolyticbacter albus]|uniref:Crp/Fnr family transcriptional regulator n=1 Tax=Chitinolyticbacter albus TaxID=2961951 RepID=UPI00210ACC2D|nr:Crp/Fnr family transcriptional regulator [Chitinolyticbacter albus]